MNMMNNLFSVFDPCTGMLSLNWMSSMLFIMLIPYKTWMLQNNLTMTMWMMIKTLNNEMSMLMKYKGTNLIMIMIVMMLLFNNIMGLAPYVFTSSAHLTFSLTMALPMWIALMMYGWLKETNHMFSHMVPNGIPSMLMPFMVMIETISNIIRPGSLAVRLTANMIAGHLLMTLLGSEKSTLMLISCMIIYISLMMFELAVAVIQSYVFMTLMTLYSSEI